MKCISDGVALAIIVNMWECPFNVVTKVEKDKNSDTSVNIFKIG